MQRRCFCFHPHLLKGFLAKTQWTKSPMQMQIGSLNDKNFKTLEKQKSAKKSACIKTIVLAWQRRLNLIQMRALFA